MNKHFYAVIMAGGGGTRLWPMSRRSRPKQMLKLGSGKALYQLAVERMNGLVPPEQILVVTGADMAADLQELCPQIPAENYLLEPAPRGTAAVVGLAAAYLQKRDPQASMAVLTSDHLISDVDLFQKLLKTAESVARKGYLVTLGIHPTSPSTGYGYIQRGESLDLDEGQPVFKVLKFKEKPDEVTALAMIEDGQHDWNSGMFIWTVENIWQEFRKQMPDLYEALVVIAEGWGDPGQKEKVESAWMAIRPQTIDYGIMEHAQQVAVIPAEGLGWNDVGSWDSLFEVLPADETGTIALVDHYLGMETQHNLVISEKADRLVALVGVEDLVVIDSGDILLVCHQSKSQKVREIVQLLKQAGKNRYL